MLLFNQRNPCAALRTRDAWRAANGASVRANAANVGDCEVTIGIKNNVWVDFFEECETHEILLLVGWVGGEKGVSC